MLMLVVMGMVNMGMARMIQLRKQTLLYYLDLVKMATVIRLVCLLLHHHLAIIICFAQMMVMMMVHTKNMSMNMTIRGNNILVLYTK